MRIYVAGRFQSYAKVRACIDALVERGHEITYDWTRSPEFGADGHPVDPGTIKNGFSAPGYSTRQALARYAVRDIQGVREADALVLLADDSLAGAWVEMGIALERGTPIYVIKPERWTIFLECPEVTTLGSLGELYLWLGVGG